MHNAILQHFLQERHTQNSIYIYIAFLILHNFWQSLRYSAAMRLLQSDRLLLAPSSQETPFTANQGHHMSSAVTPLKTKHESGKDKIKHSKGCKA